MPIADTLGLANICLAISGLEMPPKAMIFSAASGNASNSSKSNGLYLFPRSCDRQA